MTRKPFGDWLDAALADTTAMYLEAWRKARDDIEARGITDPKEAERIMTEALALVAPYVADEVELRFKAAIATGWRSPDSPENVE